MCHFIFFPYFFLLGGEGDLLNLLIALMATFSIILIISFFIFGIIFSIIFKKSSEIFKLRIFAICLVITTLISVFSFCVSVYIAEQLSSFMLEFYTIVFYFLLSFSLNFIFICQIYLKTTPIKSLYLSLLTAIFIGPFLGLLCFI